MKNYSPKNSRLSKLNREILNLLDPTNYDDEAYYEFVLSYVAINDALGKSEMERPNTWRCLQKMADKGLLTTITVKDTRYAGNGKYTITKEEHTGYMLNDPELKQRAVDFQEVRHSIEHINAKVSVMFERFH